MTALVALLILSSAWATAQPAQPDPNLRPWEFEIDRSVTELRLQLPGIDHGVEQGPFATESLLVFHIARMINRLRKPEYRVTEPVIIIKGIKQ